MKAEPAGVDAVRIMLPILCRVWRRAKLEERVPWVCLHSRNIRIQFWRS